jgi:formate transporter
MKHPMSNEIRIDALLPVEMALRAEQIGMRKAAMATVNLFALALLAGAFVALGAIFSTTVAAGAGGVLPYGVSRLLIGLSFCLGLILIIVGGAELFTGNTLIIMAWASGKVSTTALLRNWLIVYLGNFVGALGTAILLVASKQYTFGAGSVGITALAIADAKVHFTFLQAIALGVLCNGLVCLAVWLTFSARSTTDKIAAILFPITAFVTAGFEHSIANMYFIPLGLLIKAFDPVFAQNSGLDLTALTWRAFWVDNLLPVTIGNIGGGVVLVAAVYWLIFLHRPPADR